MAIRPLSQILSAISAIRNETIPGANTRGRVADVMQDTIESLRVEFATHAAYRAAAELADGTFFTVISPPGEWRYSTSSGAGFADDNRTILKRTGVLDASNGRAFSTRAGATVPTFDALRGLRGTNQDHVHVQAHTTFGDGGGGIFDRAAIGSYVDDGCTTATAGGNAWLRRGATHQLPLPWIGCDPRGTAACDTAFDAAIAWQQADREHRSLLVTDGTFLLERSHTIPQYGFTIRGQSKRHSILYFAGGPDISLFTHSIGVWGFTAKNFTVKGGADCGNAIFDLTNGTACWYEFDVDLNVGGEWLYWLHATCPEGEVVRGAFQWGRLRLTNFEDVWGTYHYAHNGIYMAGGYWNCCDMHVEAMQLPGTAIYLEQAASYQDGNYSLRITGNAQVCGRGLHILHGAHTIVESWADESNVNPSIFDSVVECDFRLSSFGTEAILIGVRDCRFNGIRSRLTQDADCIGNEFVSCGNRWYDPIPRTNMSSHGQGHAWSYSTGDYLTRGGAWHGLNDVANILLNGDCARFVDGKLWGFYGLHTAEQCGVGCADTTTTPYVDHCVLWGYSSGGWHVGTPVLEHIDPTWIGCRVSMSLKWRRGAGTVEGDAPSFTLGPLGTLPSSAWNHQPIHYSTIDCGDGWSLSVFSVRIDAEMVAAGGVSFYVQGLDTQYFYFAEMGAYVGHNPSRLFARCGESPFRPGLLLAPTGSLSWHGTGGTPPATDPATSSAWIDGDTYYIDDPVVETDATGSFITVAMRYAGSSWVSLQLDSGRVGVP